MQFKRSGNYNKAALAKARERGSKLKGRSKRPAAKLSSAEFEAVEAYTTKRFVVTNSALRKGLTLKFPDIVEGLDSAIAKQRPMRENLVTYRGLDWRTLPWELAKHLREPGGIFKDKGFFSTSSDPEVAGSFSKKYRRRGATFVVEIPEGARVLDMEAVLGRRHEKEILIPRDAEFTVVSSDWENKNFRLRLKQQVALELPDIPEADVYSFTGTAEGLTPEQSLLVGRVIESLRGDIFISGVAAGVDTKVINSVQEHHPNATNRAVVPAAFHNKDAVQVATEVVKADPGKDVSSSMMNRNQEMVNQTASADGVLIAFPKTGKEEKRSGTWATVRRARKANVPVVIIPLNGDNPVLEENKKTVKPAPRSLLQPGARVLSSNSLRPGVILRHKKIKSGESAYLVKWDDGDGMGLMTPDRLVLDKRAPGAPEKAESTGVGPLYKKMAQSGIRVDREGLAAKLKQTTESLDRSRKATDELVDWPDLSNRADLKGVHFKPNSLKHVNAFLLREGKPETDSVREDQLQQVLPPSVAKLVAEQSALATRNKHLTILLDAADPDDRVRPEWTEAATGRWYTGSPPIQTLSADVREFLLPEENQGFTTIDWHQHELRFLAKMTGDPDLIRIFKSGEDPHLSVYEKVTGEKLSSDSAKRKEQRDVGKMLNYALVYGLGPEALAGRLGISVERAQELIEAHFGSFPTMAAWINKTGEKGLKDGFVTTITGRKIPIDLSTGKERGGRAWREAVNYTLQGSSADHLADLITRLSKRKDFSDVKATIHDAVLLSLPSADDEVVAEFRKEMEKPFHGITVPTDTKGPSPNWKAAMESVSIDEPDEPAEDTVGV